LKRASILHMFMDYVGFEAHYFAKVLKMAFSRENLGYKIILSSLGHLPLSGQQLLNQIEIFVRTQLTRQK